MMDEVKKHLGIQHLRCIGKLCTSKAKHKPFPRSSHERVRPKKTNYYPTSWWVGWNKWRAVNMTEGPAPEAVHRSPMSYEIVEPDKPVNRQLFENSELADSAVREAAETDPLRLFNSETSTPTFAIIHEKPEHRLIVYLKSRGLSNNEVAEKTGYSKPWVSQICRQPWFRIRLVQELRAAGMDKVAKLLEASAVDSIFTLLEIRDDGEAPKAVRRQAADSLLDRWLGRPTVHITKDGERVPSTPEISQVDAELREIEEQLKEKSNGSTEVQH